MLGYKRCFKPHSSVEERLLRVLDLERFRKLEEEEEYKKTGAKVIEGVVIGEEGLFVYIKADPRKIEKWIDEGIFEEVENEGELLKKVREMEERSIEGVGMLGI